MKRLFLVDDSRFSPLYQTFSFDDAVTTSRFWPHKLGVGFFILRVGRLAYAQNKTDVIPKTKTKTIAQLKQKDF